MTDSNAIRAGDQRVRLVHRKYWREVRAGERKSGNITAITGVIEKAHPLGDREARMRLCLFERRSGVYKGRRRSLMILRYIDEDRRARRD